MATVWVDNGSERGNYGYDKAVVDFRVSDIGDWLQSILGDHE
jgi:putative hydrolase of the HAD superfamily